eukprot:GHVP01015120.1.p1 GENE.GHVP01015120.1~~GHVP01015120.1.p1  ORF type:complete len:209 (+),score=38.43 GHVP01015120.1:28-627(+)
MEFLKKFSDDVSSPVVGPPIFVQNDEQESGGQNFRMVNETSSSTDTHEEEPIDRSRKTKVVTEFRKPILAALTQAGKINRPPNRCERHEQEEQLFFDDAIPSKTSKVHGWKLKSQSGVEQLWIQWCGNPDDVVEHDFFASEGVVKMCFVEPDSEKLKCGICCIDANADVILSVRGSMKAMKASDVFDNIFGYGFNIGFV